VGVGVDVVVGVAVLVDAGDGLADDAVPTAECVMVPENVPDGPPVPGTRSILPRKSVDVTRYWYVVPEKPVVD
jgi:hypothetical protein